VKDAQIAANNDAGTAQFAQNLRHHLMVSGQLIVEPDILDRQTQLFQQMKD